MKNFSILHIAIFLSTVSYSQNTITGTFPALSNQKIKLAGFEGFNTYEIDSVTTNEKGIFQLSYSERDYGMGYLEADDNKPFIVILVPNEDLVLEGKALALPETIIIESGRQNQIFEQYATEHHRREQVLSAWDFLANIYSLDPLFTSQENPKNDIEAERQRIRKEDRMFLAELNPNTYVSWYLPLRKLVGSVQTIAQYRTEEIPASIAELRAIDYSDPRLYKSGLLSETIEAHFWLIENCGRSLDSVFIEMNISIDYLIKNLFVDERKFNEITDYLFKLLERRSLFTSSEYLALKVLNEKSCILNNDLAAQLESYRAMKLGNLAPDFDFRDDHFAPSYEPGKSPQKLTDLKSKYTLVVFGASWCPHCPEELSRIVRLYEKWKSYGVEIVFVSLDEERKVFTNFSRVFPFISVCDYKKWESPIVKAYHVFATPTFYLLNDKQEILLKPNSVQQIDAWVDWYLIQGNR